MKTLKIAALTLVSILTLGACDSDGGTGVGGLSQGRFEGEIEGVLDLQLAGSARSGYGFTENETDLIVLTDVARDIEITIFDSEGEFRAGTRAIEPDDDFSSRIVASVLDLRTGETFGSVNGTLDLDRVTSGGRIEGAARFTAESYDVFGDFVTVDVVFNTSYAGGIDFSLSPSFSRTGRN